jgi:hypothetical protein
VVIADRWVDDLESERTERYRGFESLRPLQSQRYPGRIRPALGRNTLLSILKGSCRSPII